LRAASPRRVSASLRPATNFRPGRGFDLRRGLTDLIFDLETVERGQYAISKSSHEPRTNRFRTGDDESVVALGIR
jgi:hypothetical protein